MSLTIPLGTPVVPDVYKIYAYSFEFISTQSTSLEFDKASSQLISIGGFNLTSFPFL